MTDAKRKIMVVDDEPSVLFTYRLLLEQKGYDVTALATAQAAVDALRRERFDLVLCDLSLEAERSGFDVIEFSRQQNPQQAAAVLTGYATVEALERAEKLCAAVLLKPIDIEQFFVTVNNLLGDENGHQAQASHQ
jgi:DNA-binding NtrC family response regulator